jgi:hypothetical protein
LSETVTGASVLAARPDDRQPAGSDFEVGEPNGYRLGKGIIHGNHECESKSPALRNIFGASDWLFCKLIPPVACSLNDNHSNDNYLCFGDTYMTNATSSPVAKPATAAETRQIVLKEIGAKWNKLSEQDLSAFKNKDDVVTQVVAKYGLDKAQAQRDVDALMKGRHI